MEKFTEIQALVSSLYHNDGELMTLLEIKQKKLNGNLEKIVALADGSTMSDLEKIKCTTTDSKIYRIIDDLYTLLDEIKCGDASHGNEL